MSLSVTSIEIMNLKGIKRAAIRPGALTVIRGANGTGKTSILDGIAAVFEGGHNPELIRQGEDKAIVRLELSNDIVIEKKITEKGSYLEITSADGTPVKKPQAYLNSLAESFAFDPLAFCSASPKDRIAFLLEAMPIEFSRQELVEAVGTELAPSAALSLDGLVTLQKDVTEKRRVVHGRAEDRAATANNIRRTLPREEAGANAPDWKQKVAALKRQRDALETEEAAAVADIHNEAESKRSEIHEWFAKRLAALQEEKAAGFSAIDRAESEAISEMKSRRSQDRERLIADAATAEHNLATENERAGLRKHLETLNQETEKLWSEHGKLDRAVKALDELRKHKLDSLPIPGLEVRDGFVCYEGIPFDQLNQSRQYTLAIEIGCQKLGQLGLMICDEGEHLDPENWKAFEEAVRESGLQVLATRVDDGNLRSEPAGALAVA